MTGDDPEKTVKAGKVHKVLNKPTDEIKRVCLEYEQQGYLALRGEHYEAKGEMFIKKDFLGFGDVLAFKRGIVIAENLTTLKGMGPHFRKYASMELVNVPGRGDRPYRDLVLEWLLMGNKLFIRGWKRAPNGVNWTFEREEVTVESLKAVDSRRKRRK